MKRVGERGEGKWERVSWDEALDDIAGRMREAILADRRNGVIYHVGRPGEDGYMFKTLAGWGVDGHNSHTNVCSSSARIGQFLWNGSDRPSPDFTNADAILLISSHLDTGHYYNPSAQRIIEAQTSGAKLIVIDPRLSNTAAKANYWLPAYSGTESAILLAIARYLLDTEQFDDAVRRGVDELDRIHADRPHRMRRRVSKTSSRSSSKNTRSSPSSTRRRRRAYRPT